MPEIARFFGIIIRMYPETGGPHHRPHLHAYYQNAAGAYAVDEIELLAGGLPRRQHRLVLAWSTLRQDELIANWELLQSGRPTIRIQPLT